MTSEEHGGCQLLPVVHGKLMMEVMVPFSHRKDGGQKVVARRVLVIVRRASEIVSDGVDAKSALNFGSSCAVGQVKLNSRDGTRSSGGRQHNRSRLSSLPTTNQE